MAEAGGTSQLAVFTALGSSRPSQYSCSSSRYHPKLAPKGEGRIWKGVAISAAGLSEAVILFWMRHWEMAGLTETLCVHILDVYL